MYVVIKLMSSGCARRPEVIGVRPKPPTVPLPVNHQSEPAVEHVPSSPEVLECGSLECGDCNVSCVRRRLCSGWTGILFGMSVFGGLFGIIFLVVAWGSDSSICTSVEECGDLFEGHNYTCVSHLCSGTNYSTAELTGIGACSGGFHTVIADASFIEDGLNVSLYDHNAYECHVNSTSTYDIYTAAEIASLECLDSGLQGTSSDPAFEHAYDQVTDLIDAFCVHADAPDNCGCSSCPDWSNYSSGCIFSCGSLSPPPPPPPNATTEQASLCLDVVYALGSKTGDNATLYLIVNTTSP